MKPIVERFFRYVKIDTQSTWESTDIPASKNEFVLGQMLVRELKELGIENAWMDEKAYVFASIPSNSDRDIPAVAFFAHLDTAPDETGAGVNPRIVENWDGEDIVLNQNKNIVMRVEDFPYLRDSIGKDIIVTDGTTLLGADDKAGIAEIMEAARHVMEHPEEEHGEIHICFTPDEEIGNSTEYIDIKNVPAKYGYTMDGGELGEINFENFNAATATVTVHGTAIHPGESKGRMRNAVLMGVEFINKLPWRESPVNTEGYEGFYHVTDFKGSVDRAEITIAVRDFEEVGYEVRKKRIYQTVDFMNDYYGPGTIEAKIEDYYLNMSREVEKHPEVKEYALEAMRRAKIEPIVIPIRGGTDGSSISFMGMPCPNIFMGSANSHSIYEYCTVQSMEKATEVILNIIKIFAEK